MVKIVGFGNPLLDISVKLNNNELLDKYNVMEDEQCEIDSKKMKALLKDIEIYDGVYSPGGSVQNTLRLLQWLLNSNGSTLMFGGIGDDQQGINLKNLVEKCGVNTNYTVLKDKPTGTVVALIKDRYRSLVAYLGAAESIELKDINTPEVDKILTNSDHIYMEGFFVTKREGVAKYIQKFCEDHNKTFILNLSAPYIIKENAEIVIHLVNSCEILFGNKKEFSALKEIMKFEGTSQELTLHLLHSFANKRNSKLGKIVVATNSSNWVVCGHSKNVLEKVEVPKIEDGKIIDTNGAGDAFSAGFLAGFFCNKQPKDCLKIGFWTAAQIIQKVGCSIPQFSITIDEILSK